jgi:hypothetical protein
MNADVLLALMAKASAVFAREGEFLSFPLTPLVFSAAHLGFQDGTLPPSESLTAMAEFSRIINTIPDGVVYPPAKAAILWDVFHDVFQTAQLANSNRTQEEERQYQAALAVLYSTDQEGLRKPTAKYQAYRQWKDAWLTASQQLNNRSIEAQASSDPAVKQRWQQDRPILDRQLNDIMAHWQGEGFKDEIEKAEGIISALGAKSPSSMWESWRSLFGEGTNMLSTPDDAFFPSGFSPTDALREGAWQTFSLSRNEIASLVAQSPPELQARLDPTRQIDVDRITFEYTSVGVTRPWAPTDMFAARFWKLPAIAQILSDGAANPSGRLPGYVCGLVFARNIQTVAAAAPAPVAHPPSPLPFPPHVPSPPPSPPHVPPHPPLITPVWGPMGSAQRLTIARPFFFESVAGTPTHPLAASLSLQPRPAFAMPARTTLLAQPAKPATSPTPTVNVAAVSFARSRLQAFGVRRIVLPQGGSAQPQPSPQPAPSTPPDIQILAFICKRVPQCPDPDPTLTW